MTDELNDRLSEAGGAPAPAPRAEFAASLEDRLRAIHATGMTGPAAPTTPFPRTRLLVTITAAVVLVIAAVSAAALRNDGHRQVQLTSATGALLVLPDGSVIPGVAGLRLPDGTVIRTGPEGRANVRGVELGANAEGVIVDGRLRVGRPAPTPTRPPTTATTRRPGPTVAPTRPPGTRPTPPPPTTVRSRPATLRLTATPERAGRANLRWSGYTGPGFDRYLVLRRLGRDQAPPGPAYPADAGTEVVAQIRDIGTTAAVDQLPDRATTATYRVVAVAADGRVLATSPSVSISR